MRLGFVGVGKWAQRLADSFGKVGGETVAHDRKTVPEHAAHHPELFFVGCPGCCVRKFPTPPFGVYRPWREQVDDKSIDAIIAVATPEVTTEVALACAAAGKPVMATKPLFDHPEQIRAPFYVDFWRLWSRGWQHMKGPPHPHHSSWSFRMLGNGPIREFPGLFDYGPHLMAFLGDLYGIRSNGGRGFEIKYAHEAACDQGELFSFGGDEGWSASSGNGKDLGKHSRSITHHGFTRERDQELCASLEETSEFIRFSGPVGYGKDGRTFGDSVELEESKDLILRRFCQSFLSDISEGFVDTSLLEMSRKGMADLRKIREMARTAHPA